MTNVATVVKSVGPKLVPFFKTVAIYFVVFIPDSSPSLYAVILKCMPIISLIFFILLHGMNLGEEYAYSRRILGGLMFSCIGDALLVYPQYFIQGMVAFAAAHVCYTSAFGFKPFNLSALIVVSIYAAIYLGLIFPYIYGPFKFMFPTYAFLLGGTVWRGISRVQFFEELWTWTKLSSCAGSILFLLSDSLIGINDFVFPVPYHQALIMTTYYAAQLGISLSVVDSRASVVDCKLLKGQSHPVKHSLLEAQ
ncbi:unnamed protein product [Darwinula stevensoni]|uniref:lysoplasmalogenase n=1 Tax=Darwinula stevensoni TaxID=69355 RepID=A0A7R8XBW7_9CRUS|nr:unnamed protein product [Darwinula stevensoni]CAG0885274.1 unnamed protein product [Darwinula stevensoni]